MLCKLNKYDRILPSVKSLVSFSVTDVELSNVELVLINTEVIPSGPSGPLVLMFVSVLWLISKLVFSVYSVSPGQIKMNISTTHIESELKEIIVEDATSNNARLHHKMEL